MPKGVYVRTEIARRNNSLGHRGMTCTKCGFKGRVHDFWGDVK